MLLVNNCAMSQSEGAEDLAASRGVSVYKILLTSAKKYHKLGKSSARVKFQLAHVLANCASYTRKGAIQRFALDTALTGGVLRNDRRNGEKSQHEKDVSSG